MPNEDESTKNDEYGHEYYSTPQLSPLYPEGPYEYQPFTALLFEYQLKPESAAEFVPEPLDVASEPRCVLGAFEYPSVDGLGSYNEFMVGIPVDYDGRPLFYSPYFVLDSDVPMAAGREIWGIPKIYGRISFDSDGSALMATVSRNGTVLVTASATPETPTDDHPFSRTQFDNVFRKRIPSASKNAPPAVDRLVVGCTTDVEVLQATAGSGNVEIGTTATDPLVPLRPDGDVTATLLEATWTLERTEDAVLYIYDEKAR